MCTQEEDGHWPQNMWLDGTAYWGGTQMDETGFPILLADLLLRHDSLGTLRPWPMIWRAASYLARNGPVTPEDRWEEDGGYSPFTLAVEIAALLASAEFAELASAPVAARYLRETADIWNASIDRWTYVSGTALSQRAGVDGYYVRIAPPNVDVASPSSPRFVAIKNHPRCGESPGVRRLSESGRTRPRAFRHQSGGRSPYREHRARDRRDASIGAADGTGVASI